MTAETANRVISFALQILSSEQNSLTTEKIQSTVSSVIVMLRGLQQIPIEENVNEELLIKEIEALCNVYVPMISTLDDKRDHQEWLFARNSEIKWQFWDRYRHYLEHASMLPPQAIRRLHSVSDEIVGRLEDPRRPGPWDRRGMVVGQVQSGKTSNYTALICKAADAGYKLIVVLAGIHNSLRSQTQLRLDEGFLGFDTLRRNLLDPNKRPFGAASLLGAKLYIVHSLTSSAETGDFKLAIAKQANIMIGGADPVILVVKKNVSVLKNLHKWATGLSLNSQGKGLPQVQNVPLLLIDDEADNASININPIFDQEGRPDPEMDPSKINGWIRTLLHSFEQSAYVGYTATPFANIFIPDQAIHEKYGEDLFPRSFIINLQPPSNYFGPARLFGLTTEPSADQENPTDLPLIRLIPDYKAWMPDKHKRGHQPGPLPESLQKALKSFILTCAARIVRGQEEEHNSMLIHVTRFTDVQALVYEQVKAELEFIQTRIRYGDGCAPEQVLEELENLWHNDFAQTMPPFQEANLSLIGWEQVKQALYKAASKIELRKINGTAKDTLQYIEHPKGLNVICIGGDKLSRGLTLEGLSISYYLRASKMYDTLMQMGRWFGYRPGYVDLCRLYTTTELVNWYRYIAAADEELRQTFEDMAEQDRTPADFGLGVKTHPDGLIITAAAKMRSGQKILVSYSKKISETIDFYRDADTNKRNLQVTQKFIQHISINTPQRSTRNDYIWKNVSGEVIVDFLTDYKTHEKARKAQAVLLKKYVEARIVDNELTEWTVALISNQEKFAEGISYSIAHLDVGLTKRQDLDPESPDLYRIRRLISPRDEWIDLSTEEIDKATAETQARREKDLDRSKQQGTTKLLDGRVVRQMRPVTRGLLLLYILDSDLDSFSSFEVTKPPIVGFAISFPQSGHEKESGIEYMVNNVYWQQEFGGEI